MQFEDLYFTAPDGLKLHVAAAGPEHGRRGCPPCACPGSRAPPRISAR